MKFITPLFKVFVALISLSQVGNAILNNISFKNISKQFKPEYQQYSPVLGKVALERGLIYNLRFFGPITPGIDEKTGRRVYTSDIGQDSLMRLLILLFPSSAGELASSSEGSSNFGRYATPEMVAMLLNYAHACRELYTHESDLDHETNVINTKKAEEIRIIKGDKQFYTDENIRGIAAAAFAEKEVLREKYGKKGFDNYRKKFKDCFDSALKKLDKRGRFFLNKSIDDILLCVENSIKDEISNSSELYPAYTTEQVILAFFCHKFNEKYDLWRLIFHLDEDLLNPTPDFGESSTWGDDSVGRVLASHSNVALDLDSIFAANFVSIDAPIPYKADASPASNGNCPYFDRSLELGTTSGLDEYTFADCADITIRHFANMMLYDQARKEFVLPNILAEQSPYYFKNFATFYGAQTPAMANDGSKRIRGLWNRVVGDLNYKEGGRVQDGTSVRYNKMSKTDGQNEVDTGYVNFIKIWQKILGSAWAVAPCDTSWALEEKRAWLERSLKSLIKALNPTFRNVQISFSADFREDIIFSSSADKDLFGAITFKIRNAKGQEFTFSLYQSRGHGALESITYGKKVSEKISVDSKFEILTLLNPDTRSRPIYQLFAGGELSSDGKKLRQLGKITDVSRTLLPIVSNILSSINEEDPHTGALYLSTCKNLFSNTADIDAKKDFVRGIKAVDTEMLLFIIDNDIPTINLTHIRIDKEYDRVLMVPASVKSLQIVSDMLGIDLTGAAKLETLFCNKKITILKAGRYLKSLEIWGEVGDLDLTQATQLEEVRFPPEPQISLARVGNLVGGPALKKLHIAGTVGHLDLEQSTQLKELVLGSQIFLERLLVGSSLKKLTINGAVGLLDLAKATQLEELILENESQVRGLRVGSSLKKLIINGKVHHHLDLTRANQLEELALGYDVALAPYNAARSLKKLMIKGQADRLDLTQATQLEELILDYGVVLVPCNAPRSLKKLMIKGQADHLDLTQATQLEEFILGYGAKLRRYSAPPSLKKLKINGDVGFLCLAGAAQLKELVLERKSKIGNFLVGRYLKKLTIKGTVDTLPLVSLSEREELQLEELQLDPDSRVRLLSVSTSLKKFHISGAVDSVRLECFPGVEPDITRDAKIDRLTMDVPVNYSAVDCTRLVLESLKNISGEIGRLDLSKVHGSKISFPGNPRIGTLIAPSSLRELVLSQPIDRLDLSRLGENAKDVQVYQVSSDLDKVLNPRMVHEYVSADALGSAPAG
jgi:hypothetical protein